MLIDRRMISHFDWALLVLIAVVPLCGLVVLYSAGYDPERSYGLVSWFGDGVHSLPFLKQGAFLGAGLLVALIGMLIPPSWLQRYAYVFYGFCIVLLIAVLVVGVISNGARRWLDFGAINLQPAELAKLSLILALARYISRFPPKAGSYGFAELLIPVGMIVVPMMLIMRQPDLGTALALGSVGIMMLLFTGIRVWTLVLSAGAAILAAVPAWTLLHDYQRRRILTLFDPDADPLGSGYHVIQSKIAVGSGTLFGKGFLKGTQSQLEFLPEHTTDFVFSVLAEEWGFLGCIVVLAMYALLLVKILDVVQRSKDTFSSLVVFGVGSLLFFHVVVNIGMVVGILPVVGIPLPLFSYGGSSVISFSFSLGIVLGVSMRRWSHRRNA